MKTILLSKARFDALLEYSLTIPTGKTIGKQWKQREWKDGRWTDNWFLCEYIPDDEPGYIGIQRVRIEITRRFTGPLPIKLEGKRLVGNG